MAKENKKIAKKCESREQKFFNRWRRLFQFIITHICYMIRLKLVYRLEVQGIENVPKDNAYIIAPNHLSTLDPPMIAGIMPRPVAFMAKEELAHNKFMSYLGRIFNVIFVKRDSKDLSAIKTSLYNLAIGKL